MVLLLRLYHVIVHSLTLVFYHGLHQGLHHGEEIRHGISFKAGTVPSVATPYSRRDIVRILSAELPLVCE